MISFMILTYLIVSHFLGDFILQTDQMAKNKSKHNNWLTAHTLYYTLPLFPLAGYIMVVDMSMMGFAFIFVNALFHFGTDYVSSRMSSKAWADGDVHHFFVIVGADQAIHMITLYSTFYFMFLGTSYVL